MLKLGLINFDQPGPRPRPRPGWAGAGFFTKKTFFFEFFPKKKFQKKILTKKKYEEKGLTHCLDRFPTLLGPLEAWKGLIFSDF